jgi:hypothetical protein
VARPARSSEAIVLNRCARPLATIVSGGLLAGLLDGLDAALLVALIHGVPVQRVFQFIASGLLGAGAFRGGWRTATIGLAIHFFIALSVAAFYYGLSLRIRMLIRKPVLCGSLYGVVVFAFMHFLIVPLSAAPRQPPLEPIAFLNSKRTEGPEDPGERAGPGADRHTDAGRSSHQGGEGRRGGSLGSGVTF